MVIVEIVKSPNWSGTVRIGRGVRNGVVGGEVWKMTSPLGADLHDDRFQLYDEFCRRLALTYIGDTIATTVDCSLDQKFCEGRRVRFAGGSERADHRNGRGCRRHAGGVSGLCRRAAGNDRGRHRSI